MLFRSERRAELTERWGAPEADPLCRDGAFRFRMVRADVAHIERLELKRPLTVAPACRADDEVVATRSPRAGRGDAHDDAREADRAGLALFLQPDRGRAADRKAGYHDPDEIRASYLRCLDALLNAGSYIAIATHDERLIVEAERRVRERELSTDQYEFQMLLGVRSGRAAELVRAGHRLRVYVPYGTHWYEYSVRRLQENPRIAGYVATDTVRRLIGR